ncbi:hypothetical protein HUJ04_008475 [Dendroctonus ponderosae]|nr:hypothetical protein HUJ04_008471 [Dendroctonus ponderosae]KAH1002387.1 hypothetical protein HUJ04_008475 [Dendroctonus ponderosae]
MRNCTTFLPLLMSLFFNIKCSPISQPGYENPQYAAVRNVPTLTYKPQQIHFKPAAQPTRAQFEGKAEGLQYYSSQQPQQPQQQKSSQAIQAPGYGPVRQVFVPTNQGPRQIDPNYYDQVVKAQQQQQPIVQRRPQPQATQQHNNYPQQVKYVPQPQQVKYVSQPQYSARYQQPQPQKPTKQTEEEDEEQDGDYDKSKANSWRKELKFPEPDLRKSSQKNELLDLQPNPSYQFGFDVQDDQFTNYQTRKEERDGKRITGSYSVVDADGYIRTVKYTADPKEGFKAEVSREPTDIKIKIPKPLPQYQNLPRQHPQPQQQQQQPARTHQPQYIQVGSQRVAQRQEDENAVYQY